MNDYHKTFVIDPAKGKENELSKKVYEMMLKWIAYSGKTFQSWPTRERCGYFFDGAYWYGADQCYTALCYASVAKLGTYDEQVATFSREEVKEMAVKAIRYLCYTHDTGPKDCVRVKAKNPHTSGTKWGGANDNFFASSQVGNSLMNLGLAASLLWNDFDEETKDMLFRVLSSYADRWSEQTPRNGVYMDTQAEENGWTAAGICAAATLFQNHPNAEKWREGVLKWALNCASTVQDWIDHTNVWGKPLRERVSTVTFHPDYTAENHRFVHPNYMGAPIEHTSIIMLYTRLAGIDDYPAIQRHIRSIYDSTLRIWSSVDGSPVPVQCQDWWYYNTPRSAGVNAYLNVLCNSSDAAYLERLNLDTIYRIQDGNRTGCFYEKDPTKCAVSNTQDIGDMENRAASHLSLLYLLHYFLGTGVAPASEDEFEEKVCGVHEYPHGGLTVQRTRNGIASFSHRNNVMAATLPNNKLFTITTPPMSTVGRIDVKDQKGPLACYIKGSDSIFQAEKVKITSFDHGFGASANIMRGTNTLVQNVGFSALPNGETVYFEKIDCAHDCSVDIMQTGLVGVRNDNKEGLAKYLKGYRDVYVNDEEPVRFSGWYGGDKDDDEICSWKDVTTVNLDNEIGYFLYNSHSVSYLNRHYYPHWKGVEDTLILNDRKGPVHLQKGQRIPVFIVLSVPNIEANRMSEKRFDFLKSEHDDAQAVSTEKYLAYVNFDEVSVEATFSCPMKTPIIPLFLGFTQMKNAKMIHRKRINARECAFTNKQAVLTLDSDLHETSLDIYTAGKQNILIRNTGPKNAVFSIDEKSYTLKAGCSLAYDID